MTPEATCKQQQQHCECDCIAMRGAIGSLIRATMHFQPDSCAAASGLRLYQRLLAVDSERLTGLTHRHCARLIARAFRDDTRPDLTFHVLEEQDMFELQL